MLKHFKKIPWWRNNLVLELLMLSLLITPFQNLIDLAWMFTSRFVEEWSVNHTPTFVKALKDLILVLLLLVLFFERRAHTRTNKILFTLLLFIFANSIFWSFNKGHPAFLFLSGIRWFLPLFLFPLFNQFEITIRDIKSIISRYRYLLISAFILQVFQILYSYRWGVCGGIGCRANGFFAMPQPMSIFALFFLVFSLSIPLSKKFTQHILPILSILLTKSAAGYLGLIAFFFRISNKKFKFVSITLGLGAIVFFPLITGRTGYWISPLTRFDILRNINFSDIAFGNYTNTCFNFTEKILPYNCQVPDSFLASLLGNLGYFSGFSTALIMLFYILKGKKPLTLACFVILLAAGSYTEYFPMNIFFPFLIGMKLKEGMLSDELVNS